jgi:acetolactate synthase-1/3 small subunit
MSPLACRAGGRRDWHSEEEEEMDQSILRTFIAYVEDRPGVLNRVTSLFRRRGYNIESLTVGRTNHPGVSRLTLVMEADADAARRIEANLYKLVNVLEVQDLTHASAVVHDLALIKVRATRETRAQVLQLCEACRARVVDMAQDALIVEMTGAQVTIDGLVEALTPFGVLEMVRTGAVAMTRGGQSSAHGLDPEPIPGAVAAA